MAEYYWHDTPRKQRTYLCRQPISAAVDFENPEVLMWDDWLGFVAYDGLVAVATNKWPDWRPITTLDEIDLDVAKMLILLSLKESTP